MKEIPSLRDLKWQNQKIFHGLRYRRNKSQGLKEFQRSVREMDRCAHDHMRKILELWDSMSVDELNLIFYLMDSLDDGGKGDPDSTFVQWGTYVMVNELSYDNGLRDIEIGDDEYYTPYLCPTNGERVKKYLIHWDSITPINGGYERTPLEKEPLIDLDEEPVFDGDPPSSDS